VLHLVGKATCRGQRTSGPLVLRPVSGQPIDRRDAYRMVTRIATTATIRRHISPRTLNPFAVTFADRMPAVETR
jgi:integrase/recombinase XerD